jgi:hypothetical protein
VSSAVLKPFGASAVLTEWVNAGLGKTSVRESGQLPGSSQPETRAWSFVDGAQAVTENVEDWAIRW